MKNTQDEEHFVVKTKTPDDIGIENLVEDNDLISKDLTWEEMGIRKEIIEGLMEMSFIKPSKIQSTSYPLIMREPFSHLVAQAKNGAGKTGAFGLGVVSRVDENDPSIQAVIFAHTRELVNQIEEVLGKIAKFTKIKVTSLQSTDKHKELGQVVVITPGHFDNTFLKRKAYKLDKLKMLVLDEADYLLSNDVTQRVVEKTFKYFANSRIKVQTLLFSATFTDDNFKLIKKYYKRANMIEIAKEELTLKNVKQVYYRANTREEKVNFIAEYLKKQWNQERIIIFVNTRDYNVKLSEKLRSMGYKVYVLQGGDMDPKNRDETIKHFNKGNIQILLTTNVLARGFDEKLVQLVINFDIPDKKENAVKALVSLNRKRRDNPQFLSINDNVKIKLLPVGFDPNKLDNHIIATAIELDKSNNVKKVVIVTNDNELINNIEDCITNGTLNEQIEIINLDELLIRLSE